MRKTGIEIAQDGPQTLALAEETLRNATSAASATNQEGGPSGWWKVFGGTLLSIAALVAITLCQHFNSRLNALQADVHYQSADFRKDLQRLGEGQGELLKKDEFNTRLKSVWDSLKDLHDTSANLAALKDRAARTEQQLQAAAEERKALLREVQQLREQSAADQERRQLLRELQTLRERLAAVEGRKQEKAAAGGDE